MRSGHKLFLLNNLSYIVRTVRHVSVTRAIQVDIMPSSLCQSRPPTVHLSRTRCRQVPREGIRHDFYRTLDNSPTNIINMCICSEDYNN